ncbi:hypothetical protein FDP41_004935 [Naegleria fowleri]|uniref:Uncharacterized protein n=1 Tax=Naegleria fowleri TaxID=5763 RepID=A0A6A5BR17_NAEFO|nr:uncharacterized protein FDP41_004935 [Naegleria fowleri]KAF0976260.1 hypothetical protein FDP41_004935 [Naegleria fowleri]
MFGRIRMALATLFPGEKRRLWWAFIIAAVAVLLIGSFVDREHWFLFGKGSLASSTRQSSKRNYHSSNTTTDSSSMSFSSSFAQLESTTSLINSQTTPCEDYQVAYYPDDDETQPLQCGECIPGTSGIDTPEFCNLDEYCTDEGKCEKVTSHPLFRAACPRELGRALTKDGWCGPGLRCLQHTCRQCVTGMMDYADGKICVDDVWTFDTLKIGFYHPTVIFLTAFVVLVALNMLLDGCIDALFALQKRRRRRIEENLKTFYQYMVSTQQEQPSQKQSPSDDL